MTPPEPPSPPSSAPASNAWAFLALGGLLTSLLPLTMDTYLPGFPEMAAHYGVDVGALQLTVSTALLGFALGQLIWGPITDRFGRKRPMAIGLIAFIAISIACAFAPSLTWLIWLRLAQALTGCVAVVGGRAMARDLYEGKALAHAMSIIFLIFGLSPIAAPIIGAVTIGIWGWEASFIALAVIGLIGLIGLLVHPETLPFDRRRAHGAAETGRAFVTVLRNPIALRAATLTFLTGAALFAWVAVAPAALMTDSGLSLTAFTIVFAIVSAGQVVVARFNTMWLKTHDVHRVLALLVTVMMLGAIIVLAATWLGAPLWLRVILLTLCVSPTIAIFGNTMTIGLQPFAAIAGAVAGIIGATQTIGGAASAAILAGLPIPSTMAMAIGMAIPMLLAFPIALSMRRLPAAA